MKTIAVIVAGGSGTRFGAEVPKQFLSLGGKPILMRTIEAFDQALTDGDHGIVVTLPADQMALWRELCERYAFNVPHRVVPGGETRWHSVKNALGSIGDPAGVDVIAVHDGVRPLASKELIRRTLEAARSTGAAIPVVTLNDSVRQVDGDTSHALDRSSLRAVQTPQAFDARLLLEAYGQPFDPTFTDDASVVERYGHGVTLVDGDPQNLKITRPMDLALAEYLLDNDA
ncbi:MAG: 2-C-methyl-D-erythritol 4-phosphate cytidylyltransferase [Muribaculaceae bacterium]|nr:2-C-methyl-D-erythritol 4-phosphate cytidylyltransferase [Muribaculaceae bacterium]